MTDREMLELAAKAAGYGLPGKGDHDEIGRQYDPELGLWVMWDYGQWHWFRPHLNDGQALRLAVRLGIADLGNFFDGEEADPYAATRLAITRAAAEIGKSMEKSK